MNYRVVILPAAERDIDRIVQWWSQHRSSEQAERWYRQIYVAISELSDQPERLPVAAETDLVPTGLRELHFGLGSRATHRIILTVIGLKCGCCVCVMPLNKT
ncbi:hypothetical protein AYO47_06960 [Planctomyces sp. SCGC AG-212-M04]|nr:hypothetical protein AYO47_06960 [Planctomyces sp. SCGC AG-212-M04]